MTVPLTAALACGALLFGAAQIDCRVRPLVEDAPVALTAQQNETLEKAAAASLFGQFRSSMADFLWLKVDKYMHSGVDLRGLTPAEQRDIHTARATSHEGKETGNREHAGDETTVVPQKAQDWRGVFGDLERQVKPFQNMHDHAHRDPREALPLFRLMAWSNPKFVNAYTIGAATLARDPKKLPEALAFLEEGARHNPESVAIQEALGWLLTAKRRDFDAGAPHLRRAIALGAAKDPQAMTSDEKESFQGAYRWLVINRSYAGDHREAYLVAREGVARFPDDISCRLYLKRHPELPR